MQPIPTDIGYSDTAPKAVARAVPMDMRPTTGVRPDVDPASFMRMHATLAEHGKIIIGAASILGSITAELGGSSDLISARLAAGMDGNGQRRADAADAPTSIGAAMTAT